MVLKKEEEKERKKKSRIGERAQQLRALAAHAED